MTKSLRIAVADDENDMRDYFATILPRMGHVVISIAENGRQLVEHCQQQAPDLVITDIKMPEMGGIEAASVIATAQPVPIILVSAYHDQQLIHRAEQDHIAAYLVKPIKQADLETAIALAVHRFEQFQTLRQEAVGLRQALEDRKTIEQAKSILMQRTGLSEKAAFERMQKISGKKNKKLVEIAFSILLAEEALQRPKDQ